MKSAKLFLALALLSTAAAANAAVTPDQAARLKKDLTPMGSERAGNKDGSIPEWTGGLTKPTPGFTNGGRRPDPFAGEKPVLQITAQNMAQYADHLTEGTRALLRKYPSFRLDVYKTHRSAALPQYVYDNTFKNATTAILQNSAAGPYAKGAFGGYPFPIPKTGEEVMLNTRVRWRAPAWVKDERNYQVTADGKRVLLSDVTQTNVAPYYDKDSSEDKYDGNYWITRVDTHGPAIRAGESIIGKQAVDEAKTATWVYLVGQRRVRKLPNACCDTPTPALAGMATFDEFETHGARIDRFEWKLVGKKEMYIPYNNNRALTATKDADLVGPKHYNPDYVRWEMHRVWVVEATLKPGQRHVAPKSVYYIDEDTWLPVAADRWDAKGQLWRALYSFPVAMPDVPGVINYGFVVYDLLASSYVASGVAAEVKQQYKIIPPPKDSYFAPENMGGSGVR